MALLALLYPKRDFPEGYFNRDLVCVISLLTYQVVGVFRSAEHCIYEECEKRTLAQNKLSSDLGTHCLHKVCEVRVLNTL